MTHHYSDNGVKLKLIGGIETRYLTDTWYKSIEIDLVDNQCSDSTETKWNYHPVDKTCRYRTKRLFTYRQFYDVNNWDGKDTGKWFIDHFRSLCFDPTDCTPMKYNSIITYTSTYVYCRRIINADTGFLQRTTTYTEYGTVAPTPEDITVADLLCTGTTRYFDSELLSCT